MTAGSGQRTTPGKSAQFSQLRSHLRFTVAQLPPAVAQIATHMCLKNSKRASPLSSLVVSPLSSLLVSSAFLGHPRRSTRRRQHQSA